MVDKILSFNGTKLTEIVESEKVKLDRISKRDIAIIGMDGQFGEMKDLYEFWNALKSGKDCIREFPENRKEDIMAFLKSQGMGQDNTEFQVSAFMSHIDKFDYSFFNISPREASLMDPNQKIFLETVWRAIEDSGFGGLSLKGTKTGIFLGDVGNSFPDYKTMIYFGARDKYAMCVPGNIKSIIASRISYILDLKGPAVMVDTACSSSLVAVHMACQSLFAGECEMAIAGGINIRLMPIKDASSNIGIKSHDGKARTFDDSSDGTGGGEGVAAIVLKPLAKALKDGDSIYAVIKGTASNQDGSSIGITAPNSAAQEELLMQAWRNACIEPDTISYIEAHGTGTKLGDPIEIDGISRAFRNYTNKRQFCAIGAAKTNIGHLDSASGITGLVKAVLSLKNRQIPPTIHFSRPNKSINFEDSPVYVNDKLREWEVQENPRRCGVSSFGLSGTNCHIVLEEAPTRPVSLETINTPMVFTLSANSLNSFRALVDSYKKFLEENNEINLMDLCFTSNIGRGHYKFRAAILVSNNLSLIEGLDKLLYLEDTYTDLNTFFARHIIVSESKEIKENSEITVQEKKYLSYKTDELIKNLDIASHDQYTINLIEICKLYVNGAEVNWKALYIGKTFRRLNMPVYQFDGERCWYLDNTQNIEMKSLYHTVEWKNEKLELVDSNLETAGYTIIFKDMFGIADKLKDKLIEEKVNIIEVELGNDFEVIDEGRYIISNRKQDYIKLFNIFNNKDIRNIIHMLTISSDNELNDFPAHEKRLDLGVYSLLFLSRAITESGIKNPINITLVSKYAYNVTQNEKAIIPENSAMFGLAKVLNHESMNVKCRCTDIGESKEIENIYSELKAKDEGLISAYRDGKRYVEFFDTLNTQKIERLETPVKSTGVYIITGGTGGIGLEIAKYFSTKNKVNIVLINRTMFPERSKWDFILDENEDKKLCYKISSLRDIEVGGSNVEIVSADISNAEEIKQVLDNIRDKYSAINGVIHCAGIAGDGFLFKKDEEVFRKVLYPKIQGTWMLDHLTKEDRMDFLILFSSITSIIGAPGQGDYTAANAYLDAFTAYRNKLGKRTLTINWPAWSETGMAVDYGVDTSHSVIKPLCTSEAIKVFDIVLNLKLERSIVGEMNYQLLDNGLDKSFIKLSKGIRYKLENISNPISVHEIESEQKVIPVEIKGKKENSYTDTQRKLAQIWAEILGLKEISIYSNFNELGGDSILAAHFVRRIQTDYPGIIDITDIFSYPTIHEMSQYIDKITMESIDQNEPSVDEVLERLSKGNLSVEEAAKLMEMVGDKEWKM